MKVQHNMNYLYLSFLPLVLAVGFEFFQADLVSETLPASTLHSVTSLLYIITGVLMAAYVASTKSKQETKYILYLVIIGVVVMKAFGIISMMQ